VNPEPLNGYHPPFMMQKKRSLTATLLFFLLFFLASPCISAPIVEVEKAPKYTALFHEKTGWIGADGAYSLPLVEDKVLWLFGDTLIGEIRKGERLNMTMVNNSIASQHGKLPREARMEFFVRRSGDETPGPFFSPADGRGWLWPYHGCLTPRGLYLFLIQLERTAADSPFGFRLMAGWLGHVTNPSDRPENWSLTQLRIPWTGHGTSGDRLLGSALLKDGGFIYIYGTEEVIIEGFHEKTMIVARVAEEALSDFQSWRFYAGGEWSRDAQRATRICRNLANEFSVSYEPALKQYILVYTEGGISERILARVAPRPYGPWSEPVLLYRCPEAATDPSIYCYAAKAHPSLSSEPAELMVTYVANSKDFSLLGRDSSLYRPQFLRVRFWGWGVHEFNYP